MKIILILFAFLLPLHAFLVTTLKCKFGIDTDILRFWKEIVIIILFLITSLSVLKRYKYNIKKIYKGNYLLGTITAFSICSFIFIFFPYFNIKTASLLGFKYDVFFLFAFIIGLYLISVRKSFDSIINSIFLSITIVLIIFLPWYLFGDISSLSTFFGYSSEVSTYQANSCISFAQNVNGQHRFQATFGGPIRFSVFLVVFYFLFLGYILKKDLNNNKKRNFLITLTSLLFIISIFFSYSKTSILGIIFGSLLFIYLTRRFIFNKKINKKFISYLGGIILVPIILISIFKADLFLHLSAILNRFENLGKSIQMFFYNPIGYGLGIAGPASQVGAGFEVGDKRKAATESIGVTYKFLPENWYVQILLEQGIVGLALFISILIVIGIKLFKIIKVKKDYLSIGIFSAYLSLVFMANFTHGFEESATSYMLFLIIGAYIGLNSREKKSN